MVSAFVQDLTDRPDPVMREREAAGFGAQALGLDTGADDVRTLVRSIDMRSVYMNRVPFERFKLLLRANFTAYAKGTHSLNGLQHAQRDTDWARRKPIVDRMKLFFKTCFKEFFSNKSPGWWSMDLVKGMYVQLDFVNKICSNFAHWNDDAVVASAVERYGMFIDLMATNPKLPAVPTLDIDLVWHAHQTEHVDYASFCRTKLSRLLDHDDTVGNGDLKVAYAKTFVAWDKKYAGAYSAFPPVMCDYLKPHKCGIFFTAGLYAAWLAKDFASHGKVKGPVSGCAQLTANVPGGVGSKSAVGTPVHEPGSRPSNELALLYLPYVYVAGCGVGTGDAYGYAGGTATGGCGVGGGCAGGGCAGGGG